MPLARLNRRVALRLLLGTVVLSVAGCGRKGSPLPPPDVDPCYPRHYPMDDAAKQACAQKVIEAQKEREQKLEQQQKQQQQKSHPQTAPAAPSATEPSAPNPAPAPATPSRPQ